MTKKNVPVVEETALAIHTDMFANDAGGGMENATAESYAIPFLSVLQKTSPQVEEDGIPDAKPGMIFDSVTERLYSGKTGVLFIPCAYRRVFVRWGAKEAGGGFKGEVAPEIVAKMRDSGHAVEMDGQLYVPGEDGKVNPKTSDTLKDTRNHYVLVVEEDGTFRTALISMSSTQVKKSKLLMSALAAIKLNGAKGPFTPPTFANLVRAKTVTESNDKGSWSGWRFELEGQITDPMLYEAAKAFNKAVLGGEVRARYEDNTEPAAGAEGGF